MKLRIVAVCLVMAWILQGTVVAQEWSSWISSNHDVQYRWLGSTSGDAATCHLQLQDKQHKTGTIVSVRVNYKYENHDESTRDVVTIMNLNGEYLGERTIYQCASVGDLHVTDIVRQ